MATNGHREVGFRGGDDVMAGTRGHSRRGSIVEAKLEGK